MEWRAIEAPHYSDFQPGIYIFCEAGLGFTPGPESAALIVRLKTAQPSATAMVRRHNVSRLLRVLQDRGTLSRAELAAATGLSQPTVNEIAGLLLRQKLLLETAVPDRERPVRRGPKAGLLSFNVAAGYVLGADIGAEKMVVVLADLAGRVVHRTQLDVGAGAALRPEPLLALFEGAVASALHATKVPRSRLLAVGIGLPAIVDPETGRTSLVPALPEWEGFAAVPRIQSGFDCPVITNTDVHLASLAESKLGAAQHEANAVYVHLGVGIGMGILIDGKVFTGFNGAAGQIGYLPVMAGQAPPEAGFGPFEWAAGSSAFARLGQRAVERAGPDSKLRQRAEASGGTIGPKTIAEAAALGDRDARRILARMILHLAQGVAALVCVLNPRTLILGGEIAQIGPALIEPLRAQVAGMVPYSPQHFILSTLGGDSVALGAVQVALQEADAHIRAMPIPPAASMAA